VTLLLDVLLVVLAVAFLLALVRVVRGPSLADRAVAADVCFLTVVGVFAIISVERGVPEFIDVVLVATLLGFTATVALAWLIGGRKPS
jgi:multicomponent Na+:H+ antiporter subunit F